MARLSRVCMARGMAAFAAGWVTPPSVHDRCDDVSVGDFEIVPKSDVS